MVQDVGLGQQIAKTYRRDGEKGWRDRTVTEGGGASPEASLLMRDSFAKRDSKPTRCNYSSFSSPVVIGQSLTKTLLPSPRKAWRWHPHACHQSFCSQVVFLKWEAERDYCELLLCSFHEAFLFFSSFLFHFLLVFFLCFVFLPAIANVNQSQY